MRARDVGRLGTHEIFTCSVMHSHEKKSSGVISGESGDQNIEPVRTIQRSRQLSLRDFGNYKFQCMKRGVPSCWQRMLGCESTAWGNTNYSNISVCAMPAIVTSVKKRAQLRHSKPSLQGYLGSTLGSCDGYSEVLMHMLCC
jgi:hypothetical protein